ncbi:MAG: hypothetical protein GF317_10285 [Candidatus Lokiarchaeota archaeon]|nr:hypothetical protein [Candidatus Lokiarchaeota archaeon]
MQKRRELGIIDDSAKENKRVSVKLKYPAWKKLKAYSEHPDNDFSEYSEAIIFLVDYFKNRHTYFIQDYVDSVNKCINCKNLNSDMCKNQCTVRKVFNKLEECQDLLQALFKK